ncbi:hypothetical protein LQW54_009444 [Pestalotiopsis sp. IQ-011]
MRLQWLLLPLQVQLGLGAYVQWKLCNDFAGPADTWDSVSLQASLEKSATQLSLTLSDFSDLPSCSNGSDPVTSATLEIWLLGLSESSYTPTLNGPCAAGSSAVANQSARYAETLSLNQTMDSLYPLSSFELELHLYNATSEKVCVSAIITPEIPRRTYHALLVGPLVILLVILVVSYCRRLYEEPAGVPEEDDGSIHLADYDPPVVNGIGNCLQHLQFVFLTACLNFSYPGFFQPALSSLNWLSLFSSSNAFVGGYEYAGISDGIYVTNGTYGGTFGMEHMVQVLGAPMTMEIWINMLILVLILLAAAAILVMLHRIIIRQLQRSSEDEPAHSTQDVIKDTLRMVLTYFMIPIIAISSYQLDHVGELPSYFISLAVLLIAIIMAAYVWLFQNTSTQRLASLIFPIPQHTQETESHRRDLRVLVLVHFTLSFVKGIAIGGLQISGASQLVILMGCELAFLFSVLMLLPSVIFSGVTMCSLGRFVVLSLMITFLAPSSSSTKCIVSYAILALDLFILIVPILLLELYGFVNMWLDRNSSAVAPVSVQSPPAPPTQSSFETASPASQQQRLRANLRQLRLGSLSAVRHFCHAATTQPCIKFRQIAKDGFTSFQ